MEANVNSYRLTQKNKIYILNTSLEGNSIKIVIKNSLKPESSFTRLFTLETIKNLDSVFSIIQTPKELIQWIDKALKVHKVKVIEVGASIKIVFYITTNGISHQVEIPMAKEGEFTATNIQTTAFNTASTDFLTSEFATQTQITQDFMEGQVAPTDFKSTREIGLDPSKVIRQTLNANTTQIIKSIEEQQKLNTSQLNTGNINIPLSEETTTNIPEITTETTTNYEGANFDLSQFTNTNIQDTTSQYTTNEQNYTTQDTSAQFNIAEYASTSTPEISTQYNETNTQITNNFESTTGFDSQPVVTTPIEQTTTGFDSQPYITPADDLGQINTFTSNETSEIKTESTPIDFNINNFDTGFNQTNYGEYQSTTTTNQFDTQNFVNSDIKTNVEDDRLGKLEGDTSSLKNQHQEIQDKLSSLSSQVNAYKSKLELLEKEKASSELAALKAENAAIKQQIAQLSNIRQEASDVNLLRSQLSELESLRRKASEMDTLKTQLNELNALRAKVAELSGLKSHMGELNSLKNELNQMNLMRQQMNELNMLRAKVTELNNAKLAAENSEKELLRQKLQELEGLKTQYELEIRTLRENKTKVQETTEKKTQHVFEDKNQQISVKGDIIHNTDELELITRKINKMNKKITLNLLYKASVDSDKAEAFHEKCDDAESSLVLVETDKGKRFGGFTTCSWAGNCEEKKDEDAFVFSLDKMEVYENIPEEEAIGCYPNFGPIFLGCQIRIYDNAFSKGGTTFEKGLNYNTHEDYELTGGDKAFKVKEIEVYEVIVQ